MTDAREALSAQHHHLCAVIDRAERAAGAVLAGAGDGPVTEMEQALVALRDELLSHLAAEEAALEPLLEAWPEDGTLRWALLRGEHASQRALLELLTSTPRQAMRVRAGRLLGFVDDLREDMRFEETELFELLFGERR
jgi:hypothetical protein